MHRTGPTPDPSLLAAVVTGSMDFIAIADLEGCLLYINPAGRSLIGLSQELDVTSLRIPALYSNRDHATVMEIWFNARHGKAWNGEVHMLHQENSEEILTRFRAFPVPDPEGEMHSTVAVVATDIRDVLQQEQERRLLESQIHHAQKLEGLGVLAGGIAHDFNNLLMGVLGNASLARIDLPDDSTIIGHLDSIEKSAQEAANLTRQLLNYSGKASFSLNSVDLNKLIRDMSGLLETAVKKRARLDYALSDDLPRIDGDAAQLRQVVLNLVINAADAIEVSPRSGDGKIMVRTGASRISDEMRAHFQLSQVRSDDPQVFIEVSDNGSGMSAETLDRIFEPFFTTRFTGRGLGLASVFGIVKGLKGSIHVESVPGAGSRFTFYFPRTTMAETAVVTGAPAPVKAPVAEKGGTVLVVDDEEAVRYVTRLILEREGFTVFTAEEGAHALEVFKRHPVEIDLILLDMVMPVMRGEEVLHRLREDGVKIPVILTSGLAEHEVSSEIGPGEVFLQKPYLPNELVATVRRALHQG